MTYREMCRRVCKRTGEECRERRRKLGLPLKTVALSLGVSYNTVWTFEQGKLDGLGFFHLYHHFLTVEEEKQDDVGTY